MLHVLAHCPEGGVIDISVLLHWNLKYMVKSQEKREFQTPH